MLTTKTLTEQFRNPCLVVAHPDDEILWFSSIISHVAQVMVCFLAHPTRPKLTRGRQSVLGNFPLGTVSTLGLEEADVYDRARWSDPELTEYGVAFDGGRNRDANRRYRANYTRLTAELGRRLVGFDSVFTHNPWGEYGHEEHVQVYHAVRQAQAKLGFTLWSSSYAGSRSHALMARCLDGADIESITLDTNTELAQDIAARYKAGDAWTWFDGYRWPEHESFLRITRDGRATSTPRAVPLNYLEMGMPTVSLGDQSLRSMARKVRRFWKRQRAPVDFG